MCGELRLSAAGKKVVLMGWVNRRRDLGQIIFIDLRDRTGVTQVVFSHELSAPVHQKAETLRNEFVIAAIGTVKRRDADTINPNIPTGQVELVVEDLRILNVSKQLPFLPSDIVLANEEMRLKYRYIDLRRDAMQFNIELRHKVALAIRHDLASQGFFEIETPFMTRSTPEGARDYLVPSRLHHGHFYALPQSPQLFKQILMVAGCDKYMQIVRCFRDEDPRADRQAEFTQLDVEMSFIDSENIIAVIEGLLRKIWKEILGKDLPAPLPHMEYDQAMAEYGSDRPDLRFGMTLSDITDIGKTTDFGVFKSAAMVKAIAVPGGGKLSRKETDALAEWAKGLGAKGLAVTKVTNGAFDTGVAKFLQPVAAAIIERTKAKEGDLLCFAADRPKIVHKVLGELRLKMARDLKMTPSTEFAWVWVVNFPLFEWDDEEKRYSSTHHPFTAPLDADLAKLDSREQAVVESIKSKAYDIVVNGSEVGGGSIRIHRTEVQQKVFALLGIDQAAQKQKFGFLLDALAHGAPPHGGIALGLDRLVMILRGITNIRDVIAFPKTQSGADLMCGSPSPLDERQLKEANIRVALPAQAAPKPGPS